MSTQLSPLSASVTRILSLNGFPKELKTKDIQAAFSDWENANGGFRIKWVDDTSLMIVFADATVAKRAYLQTLVSPPSAIFEADSVATLKPYDGPDAQTIIQSVNARHQSNASRAHNRAASLAVAGSHNRMSSVSQRNGNGKGVNGINIDINGLQTSAVREPSPTLPSIPSQPTLNALIQQSGAAFGDDSILSDPAILATSADLQQQQSGAPPRIGDPGRRMLGAALGVRHPGLGPRSLSGGPGMGGAHAGGADPTLMKAMGGLTVAD